MHREPGQNQGHRPDRPGPFPSFPLHERSPEARHLPEGSAILLIQEGGKIITIYGDSLTLTKLKDETEIEEEVTRVSALVEFVEQHREEITPDHSSGRDLSPIALLKVLPRTNARCAESRRAWPLSSNCLPMSGASLSAGRCLCRNTKGKEVLRSICCSNQGLTCPCPRICDVEQR